MAGSPVVPSFAGEVTAHIVWGDLADLRSYEPQVLATTLEPEQEQRLRAAPAS